MKRFIFIFILFSFFCSRAYTQSLNDVISDKKIMTTHEKNKESETRNSNPSNNINTQHSKDSTITISNTIPTYSIYSSPASSRAIVNDSTTFKNYTEKAELNKTYSSVLFNSQEELFEYIKKHNISPRTIVND